MEARAGIEPEAGIDKRKLLILEDALQAKAATTAAHGPIFGPISPCEETGRLLSVPYSCAAILSHLASVSSPSSASH